MRTLRKQIIEYLVKGFGLLSIIFVCLSLFTIMFSIVQKGYKSFYTHYITLEVHIPSNFKNASNYGQITLIKNSVNESIQKTAKNLGVKSVDSLKARKILSFDYINTIRQHLKNTQEYNFKENLLVTSDIDMYLKGAKSAENMLTKEQIDFVNAAKLHGILKTHFSFILFKNYDSRYPEIAGILGALKGSITTILLTLVFSFIIGLTTAVYLEEFVKKSHLKSFIEININNLAAVPSIIFGLLGLIIFQFLLDIPRSSPLIASLVLTLMILPTIIVSSQLALRSIPKSIKEAAYGIGASKNQVVFSHVVPFAMPGILTGVIIGISRAIGETAPLLIIGMFAFIPQSNFSLLEPATTLPVQILLWFSLPNVGFVEKASGAIMVLLTLIISINVITSTLRKKLEKKM